MALGPVQLLIVGFVEPNFTGEIAAELDRLREHDTIRVLDLVVVSRDEGGNVTVAEMEQPGGAEGTPGHLAMRLLDATDVDLSHLDAAAGDDLWDAAEAIPPGTSAAVALIEHVWAVPLRDAITRAGGLPIADAWLAPEDLASIGLAGG